MTFPDKATLAIPDGGAFIWRQPIAKKQGNAMPAKILGMIGTQMEGVAVHLIKGKISRDWVIDFTRLHEQWDYDSVLVGYYASAAEGFGITLYAADHTERIKFLIAHRPGSVAPALAARQVATFDQLTQGRMSLHINQFRCSVFAL